MPANCARETQRQMYWCETAGEQFRAKTRGCVSWVAEGIFRRPESPRISIVRSLDFYFLSFAQALYQFARYFQRSAGGNAFQCGIVQQAKRCHYLYILIGAAIVQGNKLVVPKGAHPSHHNHLLCRFRLPAAALLSLFCC